MLLTERYGLVCRLLADHAAKLPFPKELKLVKTEIPRQLLNYLVMVPLLHNVRSLRFLIDNCLEKQDDKQGELLYRELKLEMPQKAQKDLFEMHVASEGIFESPRLLWQYLEASNQKEGVNSQGADLIPILSVCKDLVTVIIPHYQCESYLLEALNSVAKQDYNAIELIIVNDGESEAFAEIVSTFEGIIKAPDKPERFWRPIEVIETEHSGKLAALNKAIKAAHGEYAVILDADDILEPNYISSTLEQLKRARVKDENIAFVYTDCWLFGDSINRYDGKLHICIGKAEKFNKENFSNGRNYIPDPAITLMTALHQVVPFDENIRLPEQSTKRHKYERLLENGWEGHWLDVPLFRYRIHGKNSSELFRDVGVVARHCYSIQLAKIREAVKQQCKNKLTKVLTEDCKFESEEDRNKVLDELTKDWEGSDK